MKNLKKCMVLLLCILLITGCSNKKGTNGKGVNNTNSIEKVIDNQIANEDGKTETTESEKASSDVESNKGIEDTISGAENVRDTDETVDYDLTQMSSDMVYATVYQMMVTPEEYEGKTFRIDGNFYATYYEATKKYYFYCIIQEMEFIWDDGSHIYPDEYPEDNAEIVVEGTFETYREDGDENLYCRLSDAILQQKN